MPLCPTLSLFRVRGTGERDSRISGIRICSPSHTGSNFLAGRAWRENLILLLLVLVLVLLSFRAVTSKTMRGAIGFGALFIRFRCFRPLVVRFTIYYFTISDRPYWYSRFWECDSQSQYQDMLQQLQRRWCSSLRRLFLSRFQLEDKLVSASTVQFVKTSQNCTRR